MAQVEPQSKPAYLRRVDDVFLVVVQFGAVVGGPDKRGLRRRPHATQEAPAGTQGRPRTAPTRHAHHARHRLCQVGSLGVVLLFIRCVRFVVLVSLYDLVCG